MTTLPTRKTRIVCISDTHNQTPTLPKGDILIHAGDLTNQGSHSELKKTVKWLEKTDFEAKIVIAGNHDITLDEPFYQKNRDSWRWPAPQNPIECKNLFTDSKSITYLENESATIYLSSADGPRTCFKVFGSPCTPKKWNWAFQYEDHDAEQVWSRISNDVDIVVTHTPPKRRSAGALKDERSGCHALLQRLYGIRPMLSVFGHIHEDRGAERVVWRTTQDTGSDGSLTADGLTADGLIADIQVWEDPGIGNKKLSLVDLTKKGGRPLGNCGVVTRQKIPDELKLMFDTGVQPDGLLPQIDVSQPGADSMVNPTSSLPNVALGRGSEALWRAKSGGAIEHRSDIGLGAQYEHKTIAEVPVERFGGSATAMARRETVMINAAFLGPRSAGKLGGVNKPIVVDVELPVWAMQTEMV